MAAILVPVVGNVLGSVAAIGSTVVFAVAAILWVWIAPRQVPDVVSV